MKEKFVTYIDYSEEIVTCDVCGETFDILVEGVDIDDKIFCEECMYEEIFYCPVCSEYELLDRRGGIGTLLLILHDIEETEVSKGVYEIISHPYHYASCCPIEGLLSSALCRIGDVPAGIINIDEDRPFCYYVCRCCDEKIKRRVILSRKFI